MLHQLHQTYLLLAEAQPARSRVRDTRARRWAIGRRRLRDLLRAPAGRVPMGVLHV
jgi:hypothetical protein